MRLVEVIAVLMLTLASSFFIARGVIDISKNSVLVNKKKRGVEGNNFIYRSFVQTCGSKNNGSGTGFSSLNEWQVTCRAMFNLDYISWCEASEFMIVDEGKEKLMYGKWESELLEGEVFCMNE